MPDDVYAQPEISVAILTRNRRVAVLKAIASVFADGRARVEVVVVDAASEDDTVECVQRDYPSVRVVRLHRNVGCPEGRNIAIVNCTAPLVLCLDDDARLTPGVLEGVISVFDADPRIGVVALRQQFTDVPGDRVMSASAGLSNTGDFCGGVAAVRVKALDEAGYYPSDFFLQGEETDLSLRIMDRGYRIVSAPALTALHPYIGGGQVAYGSQLDYYTFRNSLLTVARLYPTGLMVKYLALKIGSYAWISWRRSSFKWYLRAVRDFTWLLPASLRSRPRCKGTTIRLHRKLRARLDSTTAVASAQGAA